MSLIASALLLSTLALASAPVGDPRVPAPFCAAWREEVKKHPTHEETFIAVVRRLGKAPEHREMLAVMDGGNGQSHLSFLRDHVRRHGGGVECPEFVFPRGRPTGTTLLGADVPFHADALAADERGVFWLACEDHRERTCVLQTLVEGAKRDLTAKLGSSGLTTRLLLAGDEAYALLGGRILSIERNSGKTRTLLELDETGSWINTIAVDGDSILFAGTMVGRVPRKGGAPTFLLAPDPRGPLENFRAAVRIGKQLYLLSGRGTLLVFEEGGTRRELRSGVVQIGEVDGALHLYVPGPDGQTDLLRLDAPSGRIEPAGVLGHKVYAVAVPGGITGSAVPAWWGAATVTLWTPAAKASVTVAQGVGSTTMTTANASTVYWFDQTRETLNSAPRPVSAGAKRETPEGGSRSRDSSPAPSGPPDVGSQQPTDPAAEATLLRRKATKEYRAKRYATACPLFARALSLTPSDGGLASDLGLCLHHQGKKAEARSALEDAIVLAKDDPRTRRAAAFNLALAGGDLAPRRGCRAVPAARGCEHPSQVCTGAFEVAGLREVMEGRVAVIGRDAAATTATLSELTDELSDCANDGDSFRCAFALLDASGVLELSADGDRSDTGQAPPLRTCRLVYANACSGEAFAACTDPGGGKPKEVIVERAFP